MPYAMRKVKEGWEVYNKQTKKSKGVSKTRLKAIAHMRKLYMVEGEK